MKILINYSASSNISYRGTWELDVDDQEWAEMSEKQRQDTIDDFAQECIFDDIEWHVSENGKEDDEDEDHPNY